MGPAARRALNVPRPLRPEDLRLAVSDPGAGGNEAGGRETPRPRRDDTELRLLLSLRFRIRNDLGLPEDDYDRLLDRLP